MSIILNIESEGTDYELNITRKASTIGRSRKADLTISDDRISGRHCSFMLNSSDKVVVKDLGSTNGTFHGSSQIEESLVMIGDKVRIGNTVITIMTSALTTKEKKNLTQYADNAEIKYLDLKDSDDSTRQAIKIRQKLIKKEEKQKAAKEDEEKPSSLMGKIKSIFSKKK